MCEKCEALEKEFKDAPKIVLQLPMDYFVMLKDSSLMRIKADEWGTMILSRIPNIGICKLVIENSSEAAEIEIHVFNMNIDMVAHLAEVKEEINNSYHYLYS